ncbi:hypothetical protein, partial [Sphingomonas sp. ABOLG]|uniref:hypothetical protein n=1 Tax=Sphingomonas sp. ABOLG TaxID=1985880 RepID=UPI0019D2F1B3
GLGRRFFQGVLGLHLRSFVTTTKPQHSLIHNLKSVPLALTGNIQERSSVRGYHRDQRVKGNYTTSVKA